jgi:pteridine reductase
MNELDLRGKTALITGAAKRLGRAVALALAGEGMNLVIHHWASAAEAEALCQEIRQLGVQAWSVPADLGDPAAAEALLGQAVALAGPVQVLVNNAATFDPSKLADVTFDQVSESALVNAWAPFVLSRAFAAQGLPGRIINLLDTALEGNIRAHVAYILSKHLLAVLTRMTALEYAPGITVNAISPGLILPPPGQDENAFDRLIERVPLQRHGAPEDVAGAMLFLVKSDFVTGQVIHVDGGTHLRRG